MLFTKHVFDVSETGPAWHRYLIYTWSAVLAFMILLLMFRRAYDDIKKFQGFREFFGDVWNLEYVCFFVAILAIVANISDDTREFFGSSATRCITATGCLAINVYTLYYLRAFEDTGPLVRMLVTLTSKIAGFCIIVVFMMMAFGAGLYVLEESDNQRIFETAWMLVLATIISDGEWQQRIDGDDFAVFALARLLFAMYFFVLVICLL